MIKSGYFSNLDIVLKIIFIAPLSWISNMNLICIHFSEFLAQSDN